MGQARWDVGNGIDHINPLHLYEQIIGDIRHKIRTGELKPGDRIETQADLAKKYDVSLITVKNAVAQLVNDGLLMARAGKGTFVLEKSPKKIQLADHKSVGLVLRDLKHPYFSMIVHSVEEQAYELGFSVLLANSSGDIEKEEYQIEKFRAMGVDGLVIASLSMEFKATDYLQRLHAENFPYVMVSYIHDPDYWYIGTDQELGGFMATEHLIRNGYRSIGYVHIGHKNLLSDIRKNGYSRALMEYDIPFNADLIFSADPGPGDTGADRYKLGYEFGKRYKDILRKPEALFFYNDISAMGFIKAAGEEGIKVPDDVAIVGFDDITLAEFASVPLSTIHQPVDRIGHLAVEIIQKRIQHIDISNRTILKPSLVVRQSSGMKP